MKRLLAAILIAVPSALFAQTQSTAVPIVTLDDALKLAMDNAPSMRNSRNSVRAAKLNVTQQYMVFLPQITTAAGFRPAQNGQRINFSTQYSASISGIFDINTYFGFANVKRARDLAEANAVQSTYQLRTSVKQSYYAVMQQQEAISNSQRQLEVARKNLALSRTRLNTGMVVQSDTLNNLISVLTSESALINAENSLQNSIRTFSRTLGIEYLVRPDPADTANFQILVIDSLALMGMLKDAPAAVVSRASIETQKGNLRTAKLRYIPIPSGGSLSMSRSANGESVFGYTDQSYRYTGNRPSLTFSFSLTIFDKFNREEQLISAREGLENAQLNYRDQQITAESNLLNQINSLRSLERQLVTQQKSLDAAVEAFRIATAKNDMGMMTELDFTNAQNQLFNAQNSMVTLRNNYRNAIAGLEALVGRDLR